MKIDGEVIGVECQGETVRVDIQGNPPNAAEWRRPARQSFTVPDTGSPGRTFYVGRRVTIEITPK